MIKIFNLKPNDIKNFELKLDGKLPVDRDELLALVNSWGRNNTFCTKDKNDEDIEIKVCETNEKYDLSKLDVSKIINFDSLFEQSNFNGDINSWDVSNVTSMFFMFSKAKYFNSPLNSWNTSKVIDMDYIFAGAEQFNQNLNSWDISNVEYISYIFENAKSFNQAILWDISHIEYCSGFFSRAIAFQKRFNNEKDLPYETKKIKEWLEDNQERMIAFDVEYSKGNELDAFLLNLNVIVSKKLNGLHNNNGIYNGNI